MIEQIDLNVDFSVKKGRVCEVVYDDKEFNNVKLLCCGEIPRQQAVDAILDTFEIMGFKYCSTPVTKGNVTVGLGLQRRV